jgi:hypothetical protein
MRKKLPDEIAKKIVAAKDNIEVDVQKGKRIVTCYEKEEEDFDPWSFLDYVPGMLEKVNKLVDSGKLSEEDIELVRKLAKDFEWLHFWRIDICNTINEYMTKEDGDIELPDDVRLSMMLKRLSGQNRIDDNLT